ncbi:ferritin-like domain-containing protein [Sphaerisporangium sp. TRM90804]|uniref:ferritin-like domain-containing protein n=1 Tax=Sphaerisporangium sp. TRM90804 TaxID=3031113 RepID=UPI00244A49A2|nr:ferritin-like domain-containing protein [Sphaerisporangium sp. TRM90804]MDH2425206.1 ferritin-like domain-containing protein [Sphaerisporangium sp. TRM90804]
MTDPLRALIKVLDAEHAAVYAYGVVGARAGGARAAATAGYEAHRARRDQLRAMIRARGGTPSEAGAAYDLPFPVPTARDAERLAAHVEERVTAAYLELAAVADPTLRRLAFTAMQESAVRGYGWHSPITAFPGRARAAAPAPAVTPSPSTTGP